MPKSGQYGAVTTYDVAATILISTNTSDALDISGTTLCGVIIPSAFTGTSITFEMSTTATGAYIPLQDGNGGVISKTVAASQYIAVDPADFAGIRFLKIKSNAIEVAQRTLTLATRAV